MQHMISAMQRLGFTPSVTIEQRKLAVDLAEVVIKWELQRIKDQQVRWEGSRGQRQVLGGRDRGGDKGAYPHNFISSISGVFLGSLESSKGCQSVKSAFCLLLESTSQFYMDSFQVSLNGKGSSAKAIRNSNQSSLSGGDYKPF